jgi:hypothetical protein
VALGDGDGVEEGDGEAVTRRAKATFWKTVRLGSSLKSERLVVARNLQRDPGAIRRIDQMLGLGAPAEDVEDLEQVIDTEHQRERLRQQQHVRGDDAHRTQPVDDREGGRVREIADRGQEHHGEGLGCEDAPAGQPQPNQQHGHGRGDH